MQHALFRLLTAILALKRPYLALDLWVQRPTHKLGLSPELQVIGSVGVGLTPVDDIFFRTTAVPRLRLRIGVAHRGFCRAQQRGGSFVCLRDTNRLRRDAEPIERDNFAPTFEII